jgi:hypothetical protein
MIGSITGFPASHSSDWRMRFVGFGVVGEAAQVFAAFLAGCGIVGEDAAKRNAVLRVVGILIEQPAQAGYGSGCGRRGWRLRSRSRRAPNRQAAGGAEDAAIDGHRGGVFAGFGELGGLLQLGLLGLRLGRGRGLLRAQVLNDQRSQDRWG